MKKTIVIILSMLMLVSCFGCTAMNEAGKNGETTPTICTEGEYDSKEETIYDEELNMKQTKRRAPYY